MPGPDLTAAKAIAEGLLDDTCQVLRDPDGGPDGTLDPVTGLRVMPAVTDDVTVYAGSCMLVPASASADVPGGSAPVLAAAPDAWTLRLPLAAAPVVRGDVVVVLTSLRDAQLVGRRFRVTDPGLVGTYVVLRTITVEEA